MRELKTIYGQQIYRKWDHSLQRTKMLNMFKCFVDVFSKYAWVKSLKDEKKIKQFLGDSGEKSPRRFFG